MLAASRMSSIVMSHLCAISQSGNHKILQTQIQRSHSQCQSDALLLRRYYCMHLPGSVGAAFITYERPVLFRADTSLTFSADVRSSHLGKISRPERATSTAPSSLTRDGRRVQGHPGLVIYEFDARSHNASSRDFDAAAVGQLVRYHHSR